MEVSPLYFDISELDADGLDALAAHYDEHGYALVSGLDREVVPLFRAVLAERLEIEERELDPLLDPTRIEPLSLHLRRRTGKIDTPDALARRLVTILGSVIRRLIGPLVHVSSTYHTQLKMPSPEHAGYPGFKSEFTEVHRPYLLHQDFTGARLPTHPSAVTLWLGLNDCDHMGLRIYPRSHRQGLILADRFVSHEDPRLAPLDPPIQIDARVGTGVLFHGLALHGSGDSGPVRRVSSDIRFFPMSGFIPSEVRVLGERPIRYLREAIERGESPTLRTPLLTDAALLGWELPLGPYPQRSSENWVGYVAHALRGDLAAAHPYLERMADTRLGIESADTYVARYGSSRIRPESLRSAHRQLAQGGELGPADLASLERLIDSVADQYSEVA